MAAATPRMAPVILCSVVLLAAFSGVLAVYDTYYDQSCPQVKTIVDSEVDKLLAVDLNVAGGLQRLHFHDCWVRGCDASILLATTDQPAEIEANVNFKLRGYDEIDQIKSAVEAQCPGVVSCADIIALAARDATSKVGGPYWSVPLGRKDGFASLASEADTQLPFPNLDFDGLVSNFANKGFSSREMIILSGSHTIGRSHCNGAAPHFYNFTGVEDLTDPTLDPSFVAQIKNSCPKGNRDNIVDMDPTKNVFDYLYFSNVLANRGLFSTDAALITTDFGRSVVEGVAYSGSSFFDEFAAGMVKMGKLDLLLGSEGQVRKNCKFNN